MVELYALVDDPDVDALRAGVTGGPRLAGLAAVLVGLRGGVAVHAPERPVDVVRVGRGRSVGVDPVGLGGGHGRSLREAPLGGGTVGPERRADQLDLPPGGVAPHHPFDQLGTGPASGCVPLLRGGAGPVGDDQLVGHRRRPFRCRRRGRHPLGGQGDGGHHAHRQAACRPTMQPPGRSHGSILFRDPRTGSAQRLNHIGAIRMPKPRPFTRLGEGDQPRMKRASGAAAVVAPEPTATPRTVSGGSGGRRRSPGRRPPPRQRSGRGHR